MPASMRLAELYDQCVPIEAILNQLPTAADPRVVQASDGYTYIGKPNGLGSDGRTLPYVAQELMCARLAVAAGVPIPDFQLLCHEGDIWFGSKRYEDIVSSFSYGLLAAVRNPEAIYSIAAFDLWIHNSDRHYDNLIAARGNAGENYKLVAIDHSHCPLFPHESVADLDNGGTKDPPQCIHACYREALTDRRLLRQAVDRIQLISDETISSALLGYPSTQWEVAEIESIERFLSDRRVRLRELMNRASVIIPALQEERL